MFTWSKVVRRQNPQSVRCLIPTTRNVDVQICFRIGLTEPTITQSNVTFLFEKHCTRASIHLSKDTMVSCLKTILKETKYKDFSESTVQQGYWGTMCNKQKEMKPWYSREFSENGKAKATTDCSITIHMKYIWILVSVTLKHFKNSASNSQICNFCPIYTRPTKWCWHLVQYQHPLQFKRH